VEISLRFFQPEKIAPQDEVGICVGRQHFDVSGEGAGFHFAEHNLAGVPSLRHFDFAGLYQVHYVLWHGLVCLGHSLASQTGMGLSDLRTLDIRKVKTLRTCLSVQR